MASERLLPLGRRCAACPRPRPRPSTPKKRLRLVPDHDPGAARPAAASDQLGEVVQQRQVVGRRLAEADARVDPDLGHARRQRLPGPLEHEAVHLGHDVVVAGVVLHGAGLALHVHGHPARTGVGRHLPQRGRDVVDQARPGGDRRRRHLGLERVHREPGTPRRGGAGQRLDHRHHAGQLFLDRHRLGARARRLPADVDDVGALDQERVPVRDGGVVRGVEAAVGERVRRDVEHPHDERAGPRAGWPPGTGAQ